LLIARIGELRFGSQWAFIHALLSRVPLCVSWAFLYLPLGPQLPAIEVIGIYCEQVDGSCHGA